MCYGVFGEKRVLPIDTPVRLVQFIFDSTNQLSAIYLHFNFSDRDTALYDVAQMLGQDYEVNDRGGVRTYRWKSAGTTQAQLEIGVSELHPWAQLVVWPAKTPQTPRK
jgi:hypothetical protein